MIQEKCLRSVALMKTGLTFRHSKPNGVEARRTMGFEELEEIDWIHGKGPRIISLQAVSCASTVETWNADRTGVEPCNGVQTSSTGLP